MKIFDVIARYPLPGDEQLDANAPIYRGIACDNDDQAIAKAANLHRAAGRTFAGAEFRVSSSKTVLCPTALLEAA
jgi:hypothetical protein